MLDQYIRINIPHHPLRWLQHVPSISKVIIKKLVFGRSGLAGPVFPATATDASSAALRKARAVAAREWIELVVNSQWERNPCRGYRGAHTHTHTHTHGAAPVELPGFGVRGHGGAVWRPVMTWVWEGACSTIVPHTPDTAGRGG